jgi:DNA-binding MarR family transcriptional regulator
MKQLTLSAVRERLVLRPRQEQLLKRLDRSNGTTPTEIRQALDISKQGAMDLIRPLMKAGLVITGGHLENGTLRAEMSRLIPARLKRS